MKSVRTAALSNQKSFLTHYILVHFNVLGDVEQFLNKQKLAFDFCRLCGVIRFFHPRHNGQWYLTCHVIHATTVASCCQYVLHASPSGV